MSARDRWAEFWERVMAAAFVLVVALIAVGVFDGGAP